MSTQTHTRTHAETHRHIAKKIPAANQKKQPPRQSTRGCGHLSGPGSESQCLGTGLLWPGQRWQGGKGDSRDTSTFVTSCPTGMSESLPADYSCEARVSLHFTRTGFLIPTPAGVVAEKGSEYILAHTGPTRRELDGHPLGGCGSGF